MKETSNEALISLKGVSFGYPDRPEILTDVSFAIEPGQRVAVVGNNGAGKSTLFLLLNGILRPQKGEIAFLGEQLTYHKKQLLELRKLVGLVFQEPDSQLIAPTVEKEVSFGPMNLRLPLEQVARQTHQALEAMNLLGFEQRAPHYLSGGEKKRVTIGDVLAMEPRLLLFDEPTAGLDRLHTQYFEEALERIFRPESTLVVATHDLDFVYRWADRVLLFHQGRLLADGAPRVIFEDRKLLDTAEIGVPLLLEVVRLLETRGVLSDKEACRGATTLEQLAELLR